MTDDNEMKPQSHPVTFFGELDRAGLEQEVARRTANRFSVKALRAALYPHHMGEMDQPDGYSREEGICGDLMTFYLRIADGWISQVTFTTDGCIATIASGEMLASMITGLSLEGAERVTPRDLLAALDGLPPNHTHCAALAVGTLRKAIESYRERQAVD